MKYHARTATPALQQALDQIARMNRRSFLGYAAAVVASGMTGSFASVARASIKLNSIDARETEVFARLAEVVLPLENSPLTAYKPEVLLQTLDAALLGTMEPHVLAGLRGGIGYFNDGPKTRYGKTFVELNLADATRFCDDWADSAEIPQRALQVGLKKLVQLSYWANPESWPATGYDGPISRKAGLESLGNTDLPA